MGRPRPPLAAGIGCGPRGRSRPSPALRPARRARRGSRVPRARRRAVREIAELDDPVGEVIEGWTLENGLEIAKRRVPIGVVAVVYEARPNVTIDAASLCLKSGNAAVLRGSSSAESSNVFLAGLIAE